MSFLNKINYRNPVIVSFVGAAFTTILLIILTTIGLIDPYQEIISLFKQYNISSSSDLSILGVYFGWWSVLAFSSTSFNGVLSISLSGIITLIIFLVGAVLTSVLNTNNKNRIFTVVGYYVWIGLFAIFTAIITPSAIPKAGLRPEDFNLVNNISVTLIQLEFLIPYARLLPFIITLVLVIVVTFLPLFLEKKKGSSKKKKS